MSTHARADEGRKAQATVVIPVWDSPYVEALPEALDSVWSQAPETPVVIVDNASSRPLPDAGPATVVAAPERLSAGAARNLGLEQVATEYVVFLDADDLLLPGTLDFLRDCLDSDPRLSMCVTRIVEAETGRIHRSPRRIAAWLARLPRVLAFANSVWSLLPTQGCTAMRTEWVRSAGGYADLSGGEDWVLAVSQAFRGRVRISNHRGRLYRNIGPSLWAQARSSHAQAAAARAVRQRIRDDAGIPAWARTLLPLLAAFQLVVIYGLRPPYRALRVLARAAPGPEAAGSGRQQPERSGDVGESEPKAPPARKR